MRSGSISSHRRGASIQWPSRLEFRHVHRPPARRRALHQRRQADQAALPRGTGARTVQHDAEHPGDDDWSGPRSRRYPENTASQRVLHHLLGLGAAADDRRGEAGQRTVEAPDQRAVRLLIATAQPGQEFRLVELGLTHDGCPGALALACMENVPGFCNVRPGAEF